MRYFGPCALAVISIVVILTAQPALAQGTADLVGRVTDSSGAVLPGVMVTAENVATNVGRTTITSETGDYTFNVLPIGGYTVKIELAGFLSLHDAHHARNRGPRTCRYAIA